MDIVRTFTHALLNHGISINIQGTPDDLLFQASQIGSLLGLVNIRSAIKDFDEDEKVVISTGITGRHQRILLLTVFGMYRLLGMSRKPLAHPFRKWFINVVKDIHLAVRYEMEQRLDLAAQAHEN